MKYLFIGIIFTLLKQSYSQDSLVIADYNFDAVQDTFVYEFGDYGYSNLIYLDGKTDLTFSYGSYDGFSGSKGNFVHLYPISNTLLEEKNRKILKTFETYLFHSTKNEVSLSFNWLLKAYDYIHYLKDQNFRMWMQFENNWTDTIDHPDFDWTMVKKSKVEKMWNRFGAPDTSLYKNAWIKYYGHNHFGNIYPNRKKNKTKINNGVLVDSSKTYRIYKTKHGVYAEKNGQYKWLFISDGYLTGGPEKLRWYSVEKVVLVHDQVIIHHISDFSLFNRIFVVSIESNHVFSLNIDATEDRATSINQNFIAGIENNTLTIKSGEEDIHTYSKSIDDILAEIKTFLIKHPENQ